MGRSGIWESQKYRFEILLFLGQFLARLDSFCALGCVCPTLISVSINGFCLVISET